VQTCALPICECIPTLEAVVDGFAGVTVFGDPGALFTQPGLQIDDERSAALIAHANAFRRRHAVDLALDGEQDIDALDRLGRDRRLVDPRQVEELAPPVRPAGGLDNWSSLAAGLVEPVESGIGVSLHQSSIARQMLPRMLAAPIARIEEHRRRR